MPQLLLINSPEEKMQIEVNYCTTIYFPADSLSLWLGVIYKMQWTKFSGNFNNSNQKEERLKMMLL